MLSEQTNSCCRNLYRNDAVRMLLGSSWHPGGLTLTAQLAQLAGIQSSNIVLDIACGNGTSANFLEKEFGCKVVGLDIEKDNIKEASNQDLRKSSSNEFLVGGSHRLPFSDSSINLGIMECTFSSFQDKHLVLREIERILKSRGKLAISDIHVNGEVPTELRQAPFQELCVAGALSLDQYCNLLRESGFEIVVAQNRHDEALEYVYLIKKKLFLAQLLVGVGKVVIEKRTIDYAVGLATLSRKAIDEGVLGYGVVVAQKKR